MIYLVRHGATVFNQQGRYQGGLDSPLTAQGIQQAVRVGRRLKTLIGEPAGWRIQASPLGRTLRTAQLICDELGPDVRFEVDPRLVELHMGYWDGLTRAEIEAELGGGDAIAHHELRFRAPGGERYAALAERLADWLAEARTDPRPRIAVSHGVTGRVLRGLYLGLDAAAAMALETPQDAVFRLAGGVVERVEA